MKVKHNAATLRRRVLPSVLIGMLLCEAAPVALAQAVYPPAKGDAPASPRVLEMFRGEVRILHLPGTIKRIAIGNGKLITANVVDGSLMLLGEQDGITSLVVWNEKGIALVGAVVQAERMGSGLAKSLRFQSEQRRSERFQRAEKQAMEAPVKLVFPLLVFIFPVTFIVLGFPIVMKFVQEGLL